MQRLTHGDSPKSDEKLAQEATSYLAKTPAVQLMTELYTRLREMSFPWWTPEHLRMAYPAIERVKWLAERPDIRQRVTTELTGLAPKAARKKMPDFQASLIDSVIESGDISVEDFESSFSPAEVTAYGPSSDIWRLFRRRMPWDDDSAPHKDLIGWLLGALLADKSSLDGTSRPPILSALGVRTAIDGRVWHTRIPLDVRVAIDQARFDHLRERPKDPFTAAQDLAIATPLIIATHIPLKELTGVLDIAAAALGFESAPKPPTGSEPRPRGDDVLSVGAGVATASARESSPGDTAKEASKEVAKEPPKEQRDATPERARESKPEVTPAPERKVVPPPLPPPPFPSTPPPERDRPSVSLLYTKEPSSPPPPFAEGPTGWSEPPPARAPREGVKIPPLPPDPRSQVRQAEEPREEEGDEHTSPWLSPPPLMSDPTTEDTRTVQHQLPGNHKKR